MYLLEMWKGDEVVDEHSKQNEDWGNNVHDGSPPWSLQLSTTRCNYTVYNSGNKNVHHNKKS